MPDAIQMPYHLGVLMRCKKSKNRADCNRSCSVARQAVEACQCKIASIALMLAIIVATCRSLLHDHCRSNCSPFPHHHVKPSFPLQAVVTTCHKYQTMTIIMQKCLRADIVVERCHVGHNDWSLVRFRSDLLTVTCSHCQMATLACSNCCFCL